MVTLRTTLIALTVALMPSAAQADDTETARQHFVEGTKNFDLGLYDKAIQEYMAAYAAKPDPALLYNIAQAHRQAGHPAEAIRFYKVYLTRVPGAANADEVHLKIDELQKAIEQQRKAQQVPPDHVKPLGSVSPPIEKAPAAATTTATIESPVAAAPTNQRARIQKIVGLAAAGLGVAVLATGAALSAVARQDADQLTTIDRQNGVFDPAKDSSGRTLGTAGPALIGVGAVFIVGGGVVALLGWRAGRTTAHADAHLHPATSL